MFSSEQGGGVKGRVVQRFPKENWEDLEFPEDGIVSVRFLSLIMDLWYCQKPLT